MKSQQSRNSGKRPSRSPRRGARARTDSRPVQTPAKKMTFWQKLLGFFTGGPKAAHPVRKPSSTYSSRSNAEAVEITSPKLYVGNLSFTATENDLQELFNGVGAVRTAEVVTYKDTEKSKGFGFVLMTTIDEARRAVTELHDRDFLGRKLIVSGAKTTDRETNYRG